MTLSWFRLRYRPALAVLLVPSLLLIGIFSYYPAVRSRIGGASAVRRVFAIDIPLLLPQFRIVVILSGIYAVQNFIPILLLTNGGPGTATLVPGLDMYQSAFQNDQYGYGMAIGTLLFVAMLIFTLAVMRALRSRTS